MKVLQVLPALESGGVERGTLEIAEALVKAGHQSVVLSAGGRLVPELEAGGSRHHCLDIGRKSALSLLKVTPLRKWLTAENFDIVHIRSRMPGWVCWLAWRGMDSTTRPGLVTTVHGLHSVSRYSAIITRGEKIIAVSDAIRNYLLNNYPGVEPARIRVIYRGIDPEQFPRGYRAGNAWREEWYASHPQLVDSKVITLAGRLTRLKGHLEFLDLIKQLHADDPQVRGLVVGGEDPKRRGYAREVHTRVQELELENTVVFTGHRPDIREIYSVSDVVVSLSGKPESFGRSVLEPLSMGIPVVGYNHGGVGEILAELFPAGSVPPADLKRAATAVKHILADPQPAIAENQVYLLSRMQNETLALYAELAGEKH